VNDVKSAFKALTPEQQAIVEHRRVEGARSPDEWLTLLAPVAEFDRLADRTREGGGGFFARRYARKKDVPNGLRNFALPLLPILREDHDPDAPLALKLDLTGPQQRDKEVRSTSPYKQGRYHKIVDTFYDDPWIEGQARFADGADVHFAVIDHVRASKKTKRSASGKIKTKHKAKKKTEVAVTVSLPARNYAAGTSAARAVPKQSVKQRENRTTVKLSGTVAVDRADATPGIEHLLELVAAAYERVDPARRKKL
jgi:hypothetical protein